MSYVEAGEAPEAHFRAGIGAGEVRVQCCSGCGAIRYPAQFSCPQCLSTDWSWTRASGRGTVKSFLWYFESFDPAFVDLPYNVAYIELEEGPLVFANVVEVDFGDLHTGALVFAVPSATASRGLAFALSSDPDRQ